MQTLYRNIKHSSLIILLIFSLKGYGQQSSLGHFLTMPDSTVLREKIYLHTDREAYLAGTYLWFKAYTMGNDHKLLGVSKIAYVEVTNEKQEAVLQGKIFLEEGTGNGSFYIPLDLQTGGYHIRAYTNWMKNFSPELYFHKAITVTNTLHSPIDSLAQSKSIDTYKAEFFPEGGQLVNGLPTKVAFKVSDTEGRGIDFEGAVVSGKGDTIVRFNPLKFGIGFFNFIPNRNEQYSVIIKPLNAKPFVGKLPEIQEKGYTLNLASSNRNTVTVTTNLNTSSSRLYLIVHKKGRISVSTEMTINKGIGEFDINDDLLPAGINCITLFNELKQPVCERLYFKFPQNKIHITGLPATRSYSRREKVSIPISARDDKSRAVNSDLSLSIYRLNGNLRLPYTDIRSYAWLNSELKGEIESASSYLSEESTLKYQLMDNLMLTHGWRKYNIKMPLKHLPEYDGHLITALIKNSLTGAPAAGIMTYLAIPGERVQMYTAQSDSNGIAVFNTKDLYSSNELILQTAPSATQSYNCEIINPYSEDFALTKPRPIYNISDSLTGTLFSESLNMQLNNIFYGDKLRQLDLPAIDSSAFFGKPSKTYALDDYKRFTTTEEVVREFIPEIFLQRKNGALTLAALDQKSNSIFTSEPLMLLDGVPVFQSEKLIQFDPLKVKNIDVLSRRYFYGPTVFDGIVNFRTYKANLGEFSLDPKAVVVDYEGMLAKRNFYSPEYISEEQKNSTKPDFRDVLYWSPTIKTSSNKDNTAIEFYTSDQPGEYIGVLEGVTEDGCLVSQRTKFTVK